MSCMHVRAGGKRCRATAGAGRDFCFVHDPARADAMREARRRGAAKAAEIRRRRADASQAAGEKSPPAAKAAVRVVDPSALPGELSTLEDAARWQAWIASAAATGAIDARTAHELTYSVRSFVDTRKHIDRANERAKKLERQLQELREAAERGR